MKFHKKASAALLAANIEYHWSHILRCRRRANKMIDNGTPLTSPRMLRLNRRMMRHTLATMRKEANYEERFVPAIRARR